MLISKRHRRGKGIRVGDVVEIRHPVPEYAGHGAVKRVLGLGGDFVVRGSPPRSGAQWDWRGGKVERMIQVCVNSLLALVDGVPSFFFNSSKIGLFFSGLDRFPKATAGSKGIICRSREIRESMDRCRWRL